MLAKGHNTVCKLKLELCYVGQRAQHRQCVSWNWNVLCWPKGTTQRVR